MPQFRKRPVVVTAEQFLPHKDQIPAGVVSDGMGDPRIHPERYSWVIETLEGTMHVSNGDWVITGVNGEKYPCKPDIFEKTYEPVEE